MRIQYIKKLNIFIVIIIFLLFHFIYIESVSAHHVNGRQYWAASNSARDGFAAWIDSSSGNGDILKGNYYSTTMGHQVGYMIYLPPGYSPTGSPYPVIYYLHGINSNELNFFGYYSSASDILNSDNPIGLSNSQSDKRTIFVMVNGGNRSFYRDHEGVADVNGDFYHQLDAPNPPWPGGVDPFPNDWPSGTYDFSIQSETTIINELIPHIDSNYNTISNRTGRAIEGFSMGGGGAIRLGMKHPDKFCSAVGYDTAGLFDIRSNFLPLYGGDLRPSDNALDIAANNTSAIVNNELKIRMVGGDPFGNGTGSTWHQDAEIVYNQLLSQGIPVANISFPSPLTGVDHNLREFNDAAGLETFNYHWDCFNTGSVGVSPTPTSTPTITPSPTPTVPEARFYQPRIVDIGVDEELIKSYTVSTGLSRIIGTSENQNDSINESNENDLVGISDTPQPTLDVNQESELINEKKIITFLTSDKAYQTSIRMIGGVTTIALAGTLFYFRKIKKASS